MCNVCYPRKPGNGDGFALTPLPRPQGESVTVDPSQPDLRRYGKRFLQPVSVQIVHDDQVVHEEQIDKGPRTFWIRDYAPLSGHTVLLLDGVPVKNWTVR